MPANVWLMDGIVVPASVARAANFFATKGENGILLPTDLRCTALPTPGAAVRFAPGTASMVNTFSSAGGGQSYITNLEVSEDLAIPATGSGGGATRRVWQRINDPQYSGSTYNATFGYGSAWPTGFPYVKIATINQPASTATITQAMIVDERKMANPRESSEMSSQPNVTGDTGLTLNSTLSTGEWFPNSGGQVDLLIPTWATYAHIRATWIAIRYTGGKNAFGRYWAEYGPATGPSDRERSTQQFYFNQVGGADSYREAWILADRVYIPAAYRGTTQKFVMKARYDSSGASGNGVSLDALSGTIIDVRFQELAD